jgi:hypothetical protein
MTFNLIDPGTFHIDDPATWPLKYPVIAHDVGRTNDRSTAVVGGTIPYRPGVLGIQNAVELPQDCYGTALAGELAKIDRGYNNDALIVADLTNDATYAEPLFDMFGPRLIGVQIGRYGDGTNFERRLVRNSAILVYQVGRTFLFDRLLSDLRSHQIRFADGPMSRRLYEQLTSFEVEEKESGKSYKCLSGKHDDLAISCAMLNWAVRHPHWPYWARHIDDRHRSQRPPEKFNWLAVT